MLDVRGRKSENEFSGPPPVGEVGSAAQNNSDPKADLGRVGSGIEGNVGTKSIEGIENSGNSGRNVLIFWIALAAIMGATGLFANFQISNVNAREASYSDQIADTQSKLTTGELAETLRQMEGIERQVAIYKDYVDNSLVWTKILLEFSEKVPTNVKITELSFTEDGSLLIKGESEKYVDVANLSVALKSSPIFENVNINNSTFFTGSEGSAINFDIRANYTPVNSTNINDLFAATPTQ